MELIQTIIDAAVYGSSRQTCVQDGLVSSYVASSKFHTRCHLSLGMVGDELATIAAVGLAGGTRGNWVSRHTIPPQRGREDQSVYHGRLVLPSPQAVALCNCTAPLHFEMLVCKLNT